MASDLIQNKYIARNKGAFGALSHGMRNGLALTRDESFLDGHQDIFDLLSRNKNTGTNDDANLMEKARAVLQKAEQTIKRQQEQLKILEATAEIDPLTGFLNAKSFAKALSREIARTNRGYNEGGLLVIFNFDNFTRIAQEQGPKAAEYAIKLVASALHTEIRDMDVAARTNDDEFILLFTETSMGKVLSRLQNMALRLNRLSLIWDGLEIRINLSLGLKSYGPGARADLIFKAAHRDLEHNQKTRKQPL